MIVWTGDSITGFEPATGKVFWQVPWRATFDEAQMVASPVWHKDRLLFLAAWSRGSKMLKLDPSKPHASVLWETRNKPTTTISTPVFQDDRYFYAALGDGHLACLEANSGKEVWATTEATGSWGGTAHLTPVARPEQGREGRGGASQSRPSKTQGVPPDEVRVFLFNHKGNLILARMTPKGYEELGRTLLVEPTAGYRPQGALTWAHPAYANKCVFARNDRELVCTSLAADQAVAGPPKETVKARVLGDFTGPNTAAGLAFSPDGKRLALATWGGAVKVLDLSTNKELPAPTRHKDSVCSVAFSRDGKWLASAGGNEFKPARNDYKTTGEVKLWDLAARSERSLLGHTNKVFAATFAPDSRTLATGSADATVRLWDVATGKERVILKGHTEAVYSLSFSADCRTLASASADRTVKLWDDATGKELGSLKGHEEEILAVAISPDGKTLATGSADWTARLWDLANQKELAVLKGHQGRVTCLAFSADGKTLASGSGDETVKLWNVAARTERTTLRGHRGGITALAFAPDGRTLASAGVDDAVRLWELPRND